MGADTADTDVKRFGPPEQQKPIMLGGWMQPLTFIKTFMAKLDHDECPLLAGAMAFGFMGALIPALVFLVSILGLIGRQNDMMPMLFSAINHLAPPNTASLFKDMTAGIVKSSSGGLSIVGLLIALWSASRGASNIVVGLDRAYNVPVDKRPFWHVPLMALFIVITLGLIVFIASNLIFFGGPIIDGLVSYFHLYLDSKVLLQVLRWVVGLGSVIALGAAVYALLLRIKLRKYYWRAAFIGSVVFTFLWLIISLGFGLYIQYFNAFNPLYGSMGAVVLLMTWLYLSSMSILIAGEVIALIALPDESIQIAQKASEEKKHAPA